MSARTYSILTTARVGSEDSTVRAALIDRTADLWLALGRHDTAERLSNLAADLRQAVAA